MIPLPTDPATLGHTALDPVRVAACEAAKREWFRLGDLNLAGKLKTTADFHRLANAQEHYLTMRAAAYGIERDEREAA